MLDHIIVAGESGVMMSFKGTGLMDEIAASKHLWQERDKVK